MHTILVTSDTMEQSKENKIFFELNVLEIHGYKNIVLKNINTHETITVEELRKKHGII